MEEGPEHFRRRAGFVTGAGFAAVSSLLRLFRAV